MTHAHALYRLVESAVFKQQAIHRVANKNYIPKNETFIYKGKYNSREEFKNTGEPDCFACFHFIKK